MGEIRTFTKRKRWSDVEISTLKTHYTTLPRADLALLFPDRPIKGVECKANALGLRRQTDTPMTKDEIRVAKRESMARRRAANLDAARAYSNAYYAANRHARAAKAREYYSRRFFWGRAMKLSGVGKATATDLARLWKSQRGRCALTGRRLGRDAQLDHIVPKARGGTDAPANLRWLCPRANYAKRDLLDDEFLALCCEVMTHTKYQSLQEMLSCAE